MNTAKLLAAAIISFAGLPLTVAQQVDATAQQNTSVSAARTHVNESTDANTGVNAEPGHAKVNGAAEGSMAMNGAVRAGASAKGAGSSSAEMRTVTGELEGKLDSKSAKAGDQVVLKTSQKVKTADGTVIPKGSRLVGHVTEVQAHAKGQAESRIGLEFDRVELKGGQSMAIHSMIESVQPNASTMAAGAMDSEEAFSGPASGGIGGGVIGGGRAGGGGLLGGTVNGAAAATGRVGSDLGSTAGGAVRATGGLGADATGSLAHGVSGAAHGAGSLGTHATGIQGVMLNGEAAGSTSGMLSAANKNIHLDSGTQMVLGIAAAR